MEIPRGMYSKLVGPLLIAAVGLPVRGPAQSVIRGAVRAESSERSIPDVVVSVEGIVTRSLRTNGEGRFELAGLPAGRFTLGFRAIGYRALQTTAEVSGHDTLELDVQLSPVAQLLDSVAVTSRPHARRQQYVILTEEIELVLAVAPDAYELIRRLRPSILRGRGASTLGNPHAPTVRGLSGDTTGGSVPEQIDRAVKTAAARSGKAHVPRVSVDDGPLQELDALRLILASAIREIRFITAIDAATRYGSGVEGGVILVLLK